MSGVSDLAGPGNSSLDSSELSALTEREVSLAVPLLCFLSLLLLVGTAGNLLVLVTYWRRLAASSATHLYMVCLAGLDLVSCCLVLPAELYSLLRPYTYSLPLLCSVHKYAMFALDLASGYIIVCISVDRYLRIARPHHHGLRLSHAKLSVCLVCATSLALCAVALFVYGLQEVRSDDGRTLLGHRCGIKDAANQAHSILPIFFTSIIVVCFGIAVILLLVVYTRLGIKVKKWNKGRNSKDVRQRTYFQPEESSSKWDRSPTETNKQTETFRFPPAPDPELSGRTARAIIFKRPDYVRQISRSLDKYDFSKLDDSYCDGSRTLPYQKQSGARISRPVVRRASSRRSGIPSLSNIRRRIKLSKTTVMFIVATVAFVACHVPYVCVRVLHVVRPDLGAAMTPVQRSLYRFADYSFTLSYAVNPLIYSFLNPKFRVLCRSLLTDIAKTVACRRGKKFVIR